MGEEFLTGTSNGDREPRQDGCRRTRRLKRLSCEWFIIGRNPSVSRKNFYQFEVWLMRRTNMNYEGLLVFDEWTRKNMYLHYDCYTNVGYRLEASDPHVPGGKHVAKCGSCDKLIKSYE